jgi:hypothetical protein
VCGNFFSNNIHLAHHSKRLHNIHQPSTGGSALMSIPEHKIEVEMENTDEMAVDDPEEQNITCNEYQLKEESGKISNHSIELDEKNTINELFDMVKVALMKGSNEQSTQCPLCEQVYTDRSSFKEHIRSEHGITPDKETNACPTCPSSFSRFRDLTVS